MVWQANGVEDAASGYFPANYIALQDGSSPPAEGEQHNNNNNNRNSKGKIE